MKKRRFALPNGGRGVINHVYVDNLLDGIFWPSSARHSARLSTCRTARPRPSGTTSIGSRISAARPVRCACRAGCYAPQPTSSYSSRAPAAKPPISSRRSFIPHAPARRLDRQGPTAARLFTTRRSRGGARAHSRVARPAALNGRSSDSRAHRFRFTRAEIAAIARVPSDRLRQHPRT